MDNVSLDILNGFFFQSLVQKTETTIGIFKHEDISDRKLYAYQSIARAKEQSLSWVSWNNSPIQNWLTLVVLPLRSWLEIFQKQETLSLPIQLNIQEAGKCASGGAVQEWDTRSRHCILCLSVPRKLGFRTYNTAFGDSHISWESFASSNSQKPQEDGFSLTLAFHILLYLDNI